MEKFTNKVAQLDLCSTIPNFSAIAIGKDGRPEEVERECNKTKQIVQIPTQDRNLKINSYLPTFSKDINKVEHKQKSFLEGLSFAKMIIENEGNVNKAYKLLIQCLQKEEQYYSKSKEEVITTLKNCHILLSKYFGLVKNGEKNTCEQICQALNIKHTQINSAPPEQQLISNTYTDNEFNVRTDTIHGVKGETHHATLVLDTFTHFNTMNNILKHKLQSAKLNGKGGHAENKAILELYFVAFSRATDLLCLAIEDTQNNDISTNLEKYNFQKL